MACWVPALQRETTHFPLAIVLRENLVGFHCWHTGKGEAGRGTGVGGRTAPKPLTLGQVNKGSPTPRFAQDTHMLYHFLDQLSGSLLCRLIAPSLVCGKPKFPLGSQRQQVTSLSRFVFWSL